MTNISGDLNVVFLPWYVKSSIDSIDMSLDTLLTTKVNNYTETVNSISEIDLEDFYSINVFMLNHLFSSIATKIELDYLFYIKTGSKNITNVKAKSIINQLTVNKTITDDEIINTFSLIYENKCIYIILKEGFGNLIKFNNKEAVALLIKEIVNLGFKYFETIHIYDSKYFKKFLSLNLNKNKGSKYGQK